MLVLLSRFGGDKMRIAEYRQVSTRTEQRVIHHAAAYAEDGRLVAGAWDETVEAEIPVMGMVYRDATPEEEAESERRRDAAPAPEPTPEERMDALEAATDDIILMMAELIGGE